MTPIRVHVMRARPGYVRTARSDLVIQPRTWQDLMLWGVLRGMWPAQDAVLGEVVRTMPFGRHRGEPLSQVPTNYLDWSLDIDRVKNNEQLGGWIRDELAKRTDYEP